MFTGIKFVEAILLKSKAVLVIFPLVPSLALNRSKWSVHLYSPAPSLRADSNPIENNIITIRDIYTTTRPYRSYDILRNGRCEDIVMAIKLRKLTPVSLGLSLWRSFRSLSSLLLVSVGFAHYNLDDMVIDERSGKGVSCILESCKELEQEENRHFCISGAEIDYSTCPGRKHLSRLKATL